MHHQVRLWHTVQQELNRPASHEPLTAIEGDSAIVLVPDPKSQRREAKGLGRSDERLHQGLCKALPMPVPIQIKALDFASVSHRVKLGKADDLCPRNRNLSRRSGRGKLLGDALGRVCHGTVGIHHGGMGRIMPVGLAKKPFCRRSKADSIVGAHKPNFDGSRQDQASSSASQ